ncbi:MAG: 1,4-dihydroxy-6-naphthoate synthase [Bacteroidales bacterium]|nr:1,4-dihydroxy-6-naphthoate synthase [Bacteroidales bacterium]
MKRYTLGFSTCPNDTFIFDALVHHKINTKGIEFELVLGDVEELNAMALNSELDITKLSYHAYAHVWRSYQILNSGSALGRNNGPILVSKRKIYPDEISNLKIGIPGKNTTANLLFTIAYPEALNKKEYLFSDIETALLDDDIDAGLIIHETRFTYEQKGLKKIVDLGEYWEKYTKSPIPLGGIVIKREIPRKDQLIIDRLIKESLEFAYQFPNEPVGFMKQFAQEMDESVMRKHIELYVNPFSFDLGDIGKKAITTLYKKASDHQLIKEMPDAIFV